MSKSIHNQVTLQEVVSKAGKARAAKLSPERRSEIARKASASRSCMKDLPRATHEGVLKIGDLEIECSVLKDGTRLISQTSMLKAFGKSAIGSYERNKAKELTVKLDGKGEMPVFIAASNLLPFIVNDLSKEGEKINFISKSGAKSTGYRAEMIIIACDAYLKAREAGVLMKNQLSIAQQCEIIVRSLAKVGVVALIDEVSGYEKEKEKNELQKLLEKYIVEELRPWTKKFPDSFFENFKRMYNLPNLKRTPSFIGNFINKFIYDELAPGVLEELKRVNPKNDDGRRLGCHHQFLTEDLGCPALEKQISTVNTLIRISDNKEDFQKNYDKLKKSQTSQD
jgi:hypothetical protein